MRASQSHFIIDPAVLSRAEIALAGVARTVQDWHRALRWCFAFAADRQLRQCLGRWASELEPEIIYGPDLQLLGLGYAGHLVVEV